MGGEGNRREDRMGQHRTGQDELDTWRNAFLFCAGVTVMIKARGVLAVHGRFKRWRWG